MTKGTHLGPCNRTACQKPGATWWNKSTQAWYCEECANSINEVNFGDSVQLYGTPLLCEEMTPEQVDAWHEARQKTREEMLNELYPDEIRDTIIYLHDRYDDYRMLDPLCRSKGQTPNKYQPHQGAKEMARRAKRMGR